MRLVVSRLRARRPALTEMLTCFSHRRESMHQVDILNISVAASNVQ